MEFDIGKWLGKILYEPGNFEILYDFATSEKHLTDHIVNREIIGTSGTEKIADLSDVFREVFITSFSSSVSSALETLCNNMNVIAVAFIEGMTKEFVVSLFVKHPERMHKYLGSSSSGVVSLKTINKAKSKEDLILELSQIASSSLLKGKFTTNLRNLEEVAKCSIPDELKEKLIKIVEFRNEFVHEVKIKALNDKDVKATFDTVYEFLTWIGKSAIEQNVPVYDPANLVIQTHA